MRFLLALVGVLFGLSALAQTPQRTGPLSIQNSLSELAGNGPTAQAAARGNLGLGTAATQPGTAFDAAGVSAAETTRATAAEAVNAASVVAETTRALIAEGVTATAVTTETTRARAAEGANATAIAGETTRATGAEATLTTGVGANAAAITSEATTARGNEAANATAIAAETTARGTAITGEATARASGDATNATAIASEAATRAAAVTGEATARASGDATNATAIGTETARATGAEALAALKGNNLSDLASASSARTNLGLGTAATQPTTAFDAAGLAAAAQATANAAIASAGGTASGAVATPTGANTALTLSALSAQQGVLLDSFKVAGDADDTASMTRAVAAGVCVLLGPKTYTINNYSMAGTPASFCLKGIQGQSIIQRTSASGSSFFSIRAINVLIDGVIFDSNQAAVTANQWSVLVSGGGQNVSVHHSVFKNNSGALGSCFALISTGPAAGGSFNFSDNEVTNCSTQATWFGSVSQGVISRNYIHDLSTTGLVVANYLTASSTNYSANILVQGNMIVRTTTGVIVGGYGPPYAFGTPAAIHVIVDGNTFVDNGYNIALQGDYLSATGNSITTSSPSVVITEGIDCNSRWSIVNNNNIAILGGSPYGIDCGGGWEMTVEGNTVNIPGGTGLNAGGNQGGLYSGNELILSGTATGVAVYATEADGSGYPLPTQASGTRIENNTFDMTGSSTRGVQLLDGPGGMTGALPISVAHNHFNVSGTSSGSFQDIVWYGPSASLVAYDNYHNGSNYFAPQASAQGDMVYDNVYIGGQIGQAGTVTNIRSFEPAVFSTYGAGGSILWVYPLTGGSGYVKATTTLSASGTGGGSGWVGTPLVSSGVIIGVRTTAFGSGYSGMLTITATDTSGGTGATFTVGNNPGLPLHSTITFSSAATQVLLSGGGITQQLPGLPFQLANSTQLNLFAVSRTAWSVGGYFPPVFAIGSLPTCNSAANGAQVNVSGSVSGKWTARCNATNWIAPDGTTIN